MKKKFIWPILLLLIATLLGGEIVNYHRLAYAKSAGHSGHAQKGNAGHGDKHGNDHGDGHDSHSEHHGPPAIYYIYWVLLLACLLRALRFLKAYQDEAKAQHLEEISAPMHEAEEHHVHQEHVAHLTHDEYDAHGGQDDHGHHPEPTALDKFLVACVVLMFIFEQVPSLAYYHEANGVGFLKFLLKATLGVSLMSYGILGMGEH